MKVPCQYPGQLQIPLSGYNWFAFNSSYGAFEIVWIFLLRPILQEVGFFLTFVRDLFFFFLISRSTCQVKQYFMDADTLPSKEPAVACALPDWVGQCPVPTSPSCVLPDGWLFLVWRAYPLPTCHASIKLTSLSLSLSCSLLACSGVLFCQFPVETFLLVCSNPMFLLPSL